MAKQTKPELTPVQTVRRRRENLMTRRGYVSLLGKLALIAVAVWVIFSQVFLITQ